MFSTRSIALLEKGAMKVTRTPILLLLASISLGIALGDSGEIVHSRIKRTPVKSSNVSSVGYSRPLHALEIEFVRGAVYRFLDVQPRIYRQLLAAESKGRFIAENLRGKYRFVRVQPRSDAPIPSEEVAARAP